MRIKLRADVSGMFWSGGAVTEVPELMGECFEPIDVCDDAIMGMATGGIPEGAARVVMRTREDAAKILANTLTRLIVAEMSKNDTVNGYPPERPNEATALQVGHG